MSPRSLSFTVTFPETCTTEQQRLITERYGQKLELDRGTTAQERLQADVIIATHALYSIPEKARSKTLFVLHAAASEILIKTKEANSDPESRLLRGVGRLCCLGIVTEQKTYEAARRGNLPKKVQRRFTDESHELLRSIIVSSEDSLTIARSSEPGSARYARRIIGLKRKELKYHQAEIQQAEHRIAKKHKRK